MVSYGKQQRRLLEHRHKRNNKNNGFLISQVKSKQIFEVVGFQSTFETFNCLRLANKFWCAFTTAFALTALNQNHVRGLICMHENCFREQLYKYCIMQHQLRFSCLDLFQTLASIQSYSSHSSDQLLHPTSSDDFSSLMSNFAQSRCSSMQ